jgi:hypothetical protein
MGFGDEVYEVLLDIRLECGAYSEDYYCLDMARRSYNDRPGIQYVWLVLRKKAIRPWCGTGYERVGIGMLGTKRSGTKLFPYSPTYSSEVILI